MDQIRVNRLEYIFKQFQLGSKPFSTSVANWYLANIDIHDQGTHLLLQLLEHTGDNIATGSVASGLINAMNRLVIKARTGTLQQLQSSIQHLIVHCSNKLDVKGVMQTIRTVVEWHQLRPNVFTWDFIRGCHEHMQTSPQITRWLREKSPSENLDYLDYLWPSFLGQHSRSPLGSTSPVTTIKPPRDQQSTAARTMSPRSVNKKIVHSYKNRRETIAKRFKVKLNDRLVDSKLAIEVAALQHGSIQTAWKTNPKQHFNYSTTSLSGMQHHVNALEQMIVDLIASQKVQRQAAENVLTTKELSLQKARRKIKRQEQTIIKLKQEQLATTLKNIKLSETLNRLNLSNAMASPTTATTERLTTTHEGYQVDNEEEEDDCWKIKVKALYL